MIRLYNQPFIKSILFSNLFIGLVAIGMVLETSTIFQHPINVEFYAFLFTITVIVYAGYGLLKTTVGPPTVETERAVWNQRHRLFLWTEFLIGTVIAAVIYYKQPIDWVQLVFPVAGTLFYTFLTSMDRLEDRSLFQIKAMLLSLVWLYSTFALPQLSFVNNLYSFVSLGMASWFPIYLICLLFDHRDLERPGKIPYEKWLSRIAEFFILITLLLIGMADSPNQKIYLFSKMLVLIFLRVTIYQSMKSKSSTWYYGVLDGVMGLPVAYLLSKCNLYP